MSKTVLAQVDGFTPLIDSLVDHDQLGIIGAAIFGRIWRYCQMENGICHASLESIADEIGLNRRTVIRYSDILVSLGYIKDLTPLLRNRPHTYSDTGKAMLSINVGVTESHTYGARGDRESQQSDRESHLGVTESHLKIEAKREYKIEDNLRAPKPSTTSKPSRAKSSEEKPTCPSEWMQALHDLTQIDQTTASPAARKQISECGKALITSGATLEQVETFRAGWYARDWRGKQNQAPTAKQIRDEWGKYSRPQNGNGAKSNGRSKPEYTEADFALAELINADNAATSAALRDGARGIGA